MSRVMIVPAAGAGTRLGSGLPKLLVPVNGRPMIQHVVDRYRNLVDRFILVLNPASEAAVLAALSGRAEISLEFQTVATGMLDAILIPLNRVRSSDADQIWITWCDQVAILPETAGRLDAIMADPAGPDLAFPTVKRPKPYIHFDRDPGGRIVGVRQEREGDPMPDIGEGDSGLFALSRRAYLDWLPTFAVTAPTGARTGERNFLPFMAWVAASAEVRTFPLAHPTESIGINTPAELAEVEAFIRGRS